MGYIHVMYCYSHTKDKQVIQRKQSYKPKKQKQKEKQTKHHNKGNYVPNGVIYHTFTFNKVERYSKAT